MVSQKAFFLFLINQNLSAQFISGMCIMSALEFLFVTFSLFDGPCLDTKLWYQTSIRKVPMLKTGLLLIFDHFDLKMIYMLWPVRYWDLASKPDLNRNIDEYRCEKVFIYWLMYWENREFWLVMDKAWESDGERLISRLITSDLV